MSTDRGFSLRRTDCELQVRVEVAVRSVDVPATSPAPTPPAAWGCASGYRDSSGPTSGMYKFGTRYYDPNTMRWTRLDPRARTLADPMSQNG